jgi:cytochrome b subunit of formate dehydrogenase
MNKDIVKEKQYERFDPILRTLHLLVIISFLTLAFTGTTIKFSGVGIFQTISKLLGGYQVTGFLHRVAAVITFGYLVAHLGYMFYLKRKEGKPYKYFLCGENSLMPNKNDFKEYIQTIKWFLGMRERPSYGKWTYWEKFDYFAVFWGVAIIGASGLLLWFPEFFTKLGIPGLIINIATIIHSDEALLATGFIFTVHFFNTHFRPDKFPMDKVIFTGSVPIEELKKDRPRLYKELVESGELEKHLVDPPSKRFLIAVKIFGFAALATGIIFIILIIYSMVFLYK